MKKLFSLFMMGILLIGILAACGTGAKKETEQKAAEGADTETKVLTMGTSADYKPFEYIDTAKGDKPIGIDIEIAKTITDKLGYDLKINDMDFGGLIAALQNGQVDFVMSAMSATDERRKSVDFSDIYYTSKHVIVSKKGSGIKTVADLEGKKVGAQLGSIQQDKANELAKETPFTVDARNRIPELIQEIKVGRMDAAIIEDTSAKGYLDENPDIESFTIEDTDGGFAIAFPKDSELTEKFNQELKTMIENGEIDKIVKNYFDAK
ncbi:transporter substrate-binding domain-containing protein [Bacillus benzoevorans]|uniref:Polar amino acid transport system substrate-binding protein n=1 Tax=Bacillus benzoevorans TaxID=1456 RepID=A0A7X0HQD2_9BACI|nr:transporter substrate-binding domain-containing protein [Bacillus benzoevorans]MBB6444811.1 polar amino acid transport system substrate-binding protein [Bacillus benzoevorans]